MGSENFKTAWGTKLRATEEQTTAENNANEEKKANRKIGENETEAVAEKPVAKKKVQRNESNFVLGTTSTLASVIVGAVVLVLSQYEKYFAIGVILWSLWLAFAIIMTMWIVPDAAHASKNRTRKLIGAIIFSIFLLGISVFAVVVYKVVTGR